MKAKEPLKLMPLDDLKKVLAKIVAAPNGKTASDSTTQGANQRPDSTKP